MDINLLLGTMKDVEANASLPTNLEKPSSLAEICELCGLKISILRFGTATLTCLKQMTPDPGQLADYP